MDCEAGLTRHCSTVGVNARLSATGSRCLSASGLFVDIHAVSRTGLQNTLARLRWYHLTGLQHAVEALWRNKESHPTWQREAVKRKCTNPLLRGGHDSHDRPLLQQRTMRMTVNRQTTNSWARRLLTPAGRLPRHHQQRHRHRHSQRRRLAYHDKHKCPHHRRHVRLCRLQRRRG